MSIKRKLSYYGATAVISALGSAFLVVKYAPPTEKIINVETLVPVEDKTAFLKINKLQNTIMQQQAVMEKEQKTMQKLLEKHNITGTEEQIKEIKDKAKWLGIIMYRECRGCNKTETLILGNATILFLQEGNHGKTMEQHTKYRTPGGAYHYEFAGNPNNFYVDGAYVEQYYDMALSLISKSPDTDYIRTKYNKIFEDLGLNFVNALYWCNEKTNVCSFHRLRASQNCFIRIPKLDLRDSFRVPIDPEKDVSQHTMYVNNMQSPRCRVK